MDRKESDEKDVNISESCREEIESKIMTRLNHEST